MQLSHLRCLQQSQQSLSALFTPTFLQVQRDCCHICGMICRSVLHCTVLIMFWCQARYFVQGKLDTEDLLESKGVNWTSIRPVYIYGERCCMHARQWSISGRFHRIPSAVKVPARASHLLIWIIAGPLNYNPVEEWFFHRVKAGRPIPVPNSGQQVAWHAC